MPICVPAPPLIAAWTLTLDIDEDQALIDGEHHILWRRLADNRWIVTSARLITQELDFTGLSVAALGRRDLFPGPGRPFVAFSPLPQETYEELAIRASLLARQHLAGAVGLPPAYTSVGDTWRRMRPNEEFIYVHHRPPPPSAGYTVDLVRRGHRFCRCSLSSYVRWYLPHGPDRSTWPWNFRLVESYVAMLLVEQPNFVAAGTSSYGFLLHYDDEPGAPTLRTPELTSRVNLRLRAYGEMVAAPAVVPRVRVASAGTGPATTLDGDDLGRA